MIDCWHGLCNFDKLRYLVGSHSKPLLAITTGGNLCLSTKTPSESFTPPGPRILAFFFFLHLTFYRGIESHCYSGRDKSRCVQASPAATSFATGAVTVSSMGRVIWLKNKQQSPEERQLTCCWNVALEGCHYVNISWGCAFRYLQLVNSSSNWQVKKWKSLAWDIMWLGSISCAIKDLYQIQSFFYPHSIGARKTELSC